MSEEQTPWFENWFDSHYYHLLYHHRDQKEAGQFLDRLVQRLHLPSGSRVMDLACGKGRHSLHLNKLGYDVTGVDLSASNIEACKKSENDTLNFYQHDMRNLFRANYFDAVLNLFTSFGYFERVHENERVVQNAARSLSKGGYFILDFLNSHYVKAHLIPEAEKTVSGIRFQIRKSIRDGFLHKEISFEDAGRSYHFEERLCLFVPEDFSLFFAHAGLSILETYGDYSLHPYHAANSPRLIFVTRKL
jgi:SAM-dependent methyltransferase